MTHLFFPPLNRLIEENALELFKKLFSRPNDDYLFSSEFSYFTSYIPCSFFNGVLETYVSEEKLNGLIPYMLQYYKEKSVPFMWWVGEGSTPCSLKPTLEAHGFTQSLTLTNMAMNITQLEAMRSVSPSHQLEAITTEDALHKWAIPLQVSFDFSNATIRSYEELWRYWLVLEPHSLRHYSLLKDGRAISSITLYLGDRTAGIYNVATLPEARNQGLASLLVEHCCLIAKQEGYQHVVLQTTEKGVPVYATFGFTSYDNIAFYEPQAMQAL